MALAVLLEGLQALAGSASRSSRCIVQCGRGAGGGAGCWGLHASTETADSANAFCAETFQAVATGLE